MERNFRVKLATPLLNVVTCDLIQIVMDYKVANVVSPYTMFRIAEDGDMRELAVEESLSSLVSQRERVREPARGTLRTTRLLSPSSTEPPHSGSSSATRTTQLPNSRPPWTRLLSTA